MLISSHICIHFISMVRLCSDHTKIHCTYGICNISALNLGMSVYSLLFLLTQEGDRKSYFWFLNMTLTYIVDMANNHSVNCHKAFIQKGRVSRPNDPPAEMGIVLKVYVMLVLSKICIKQPFLSFIPVWKNTSKCLVGFKLLFCD